MTIQDLQLLLETTGYPVVYSYFKSSPQPPYITFMTSTDQHGSDELNLVEDMDVRIELYTSKKDIEAEQKVKDILNFVEFDNDEVYIPSEEIFMNIYEFSITQKIRRN